MNEVVVIQFERSEQITEDSWRVRRETLKVNADTTILDIRKWAIKANGGREPSQLFILKADSI